MLARLSAALLPALAFADDPTLDVAVGRHFSFYLNNGSAWAMGRNQFGQLGLPRGQDAITPQEVPKISSDPNVTIVQIESGAFHTLALLSNREVYAVGRNFDGQLGIGAWTDPEEWTKVAIAEGVVSIAAGYSHSLFLTEDDTVYATGLNSAGQLGQANFETINKPRQVSFDKRDRLAAGIAAGLDFSYFLSTTGNLYAVGQNVGGQLGDPYIGSTTSRATLVGQNVKTMAAGAKHGLYISNDGDLWGTGSNNDGQLGFGDGMYVDKSTWEKTPNSGVTKVAAGGDGTCIALGLPVQCMGSNRYGQLGLGIIPYSDTPRAVSEVGVVGAIAIGELHSFYVDHDRVVVTGQNQWGELGFDKSTGGISQPQELFKVGGGGGERPTEMPTPAPTLAPIPAPTPAPTEPGTTEPSTTMANTTQPLNMPGNGGDRQPWWLMLLLGAGSMAIVFACIRYGNAIDTRSPKSTADLET